MRSGGALKVLDKTTKGRAEAAAAEKAAGHPLKAVVNCTGCGKIYFTRSDATDTQRLLASGACTFCGRTILGGKKGAGSGGEAGSKEAEAFKNRLVEYDRNSRQRTVVYDDQADFFEIDSNAWLSRDEREAARRHRDAELAARKLEQANRALNVTLDLFGRQVLVSEGPSERPEGAEAREAAALAAARATNAEYAQGGGRAAPAALATARRLQNPSLQRPAPEFSLPSNFTPAAAVEGSRIPQRNRLQESYVGD